jgi:hypothetical protein
LQLHAREHAAAQGFLLQGGERAHEVEDLGHQPLHLTIIDLEAIERGGLGEGKIEPGGQVPRSAVN